MSEANWRVDPTEVLVTKFVLKEEKQLSVTFAWLRGLLNKLLCTPPREKAVKTWRGKKRERERSHGSQAWTLLITACLSTLANLPTPFVILSWSHTTYCCLTLTKNFPVPLFPAIARDKLTEHTQRSGSWGRYPEWPQLALDLWLHPSQPSYQVKWTAGVFFAGLVRHLFRWKHREGLQIWKVIWCTLQNNREDSLHCANAVTFWLIFICVIGQGGCRP